MSIAIILVIVLAIVAIVFATKVIFRILSVLVAIAAIIGIMYYFSWGPFDSNLASIETLEERYCEQERDDDICECVVAKLKLDMLERFSKEERTEIQANKAKSIYVLRKSINASKEESLSCLALRGEEQKYEQFLKDLIPLANEDLDFLKEKSGQLKDWFTERKDSFQEDFDELDKKY